MVIESLQMATDSAYHVDQIVFVRARGIGRIESVPGPSQATDHYLVALSESGETLKVPNEVSDQHLRVLVDEAEAKKMLALLRKPTTKVDKRSYEKRATDGRKVMDSGKAMAHAKELHKLYSMPKPLAYRDQTHVVGFEDFVLGEIAVVLGLERDALEAEMRQLHAGPPK